MHRDLMSIHVQGYGRYTPEIRIKAIITDAMKAARFESLQHLAAFRLTTSICNSEELRCVIESFRWTPGRALEGFLDGQWKQLHGRAKRLLVRIGAPILMIKVILEYLRPTSFEVFKWYVCHEGIVIDSWFSFCWTPLGSIDYEKTARVLVGNESINVKSRFELACLYCLESEVRAVWDRMTLTQRRYFYVRGDFKKLNQNPIVLYWIYYIQDVPKSHWDSNSLSSGCIIRCAVEKGFLSATKYFFEKLKPRMKSVMIFDCFRIYLTKLTASENIVRDHLAIAYYLINELHPGMRGMQYYRMFSFIYRYFLDWPLQKHFMAAVHQSRAHMFSKRFGEVLEAILEKDLGHFKDYDYKTLFKNFWLQGTVTQKAYVNKISPVGCRIVMRFVLKHFEFLADEKAATLKEKFRTVVLQQEVEGCIEYFEAQNVEFFKFLLLKEVVTDSSIDKLMTTTEGNFGVTFMTTSISTRLYEEIRSLMHSVRDCSARSRHIK